MIGPLLASSFDPLYPLRGIQSCSRTIYDLFELDFYQLMLSTFGKIETFKILQFRFEKHNERRHKSEIIILLIVLLLPQVFDWCYSFVEFLRVELFDHNEHLRLYRNPPQRVRSLDGDHRSDSLDNHRNDDNNDDFKDQFQTIGSN
ncbi:hypothetical protein SSS_08033 [Sarcoptes scabiei]|nr:hypothetical protein SSS_08033 [Sarcoptes scabiei]